MVRKQVIVGIFIALVFGIGGFVLGHFISLPVFTAASDPASYSEELNPGFYAAVNPEEKRVQKSLLKVVWKDPAWFRSCPTGFIPATPLPFKLDSTPISVERSKIVATINGPFKRLIHGVSRSGGRDDWHWFAERWKYRVQVGETEIRAIPDPSDQKEQMGRHYPEFTYKGPGAIEYPPGYGSEEQGAHWDKESDIVGELLLMPDLGEVFDEVLLCSQSTIRGGGL